MIGKMITENSQGGGTVELGGMRVEVKPLSLEVLKELSGPIRALVETWVKSAGGDLERKEFSAAQLFHVLTESADGLPTIIAPLAGVKPEVIEKAPLYELLAFLNAWLKVNRLEKLLRELVRLNEGCGGIEALLLKSRERKHG